MTGAKEWTQTRLVPNAVSLHLIEAKESRIPKIKHDGLNKYGMSRRLFPEEIIAIENFQSKGVLFGVMKSIVFFVDLKKTVTVKLFCLRT